MGRHADFARLLPLVSLATMILGCAADDDGAIEVVHDACRPLLVAAEGGTAEQLASLDDAVAFWHERGVSAPRRVRPGDPAPHLVVRFETAAGNFHGLYDGAHATIFVNTVLDDRRERAVTIAHELGHAFGLVHVDRDQRASVMNRANLTVSPTGADADAIALLWGACSGDER